MGITAQRTRTWKRSNDPLYEQKKAWVLAAYRGAEAGTLDGVVVSFDECGPISLKPHAGRGWFPEKRPARQRATYTRTQGTRKLLGAYDVGADRLWGRLEKRRVTAKAVLEFLTDIRRRYPVETTVYIVMDNLSAHWTEEIRRWAHANNVGLLPTPTNASHLKSDRVPFLGVRRVRDQRQRLPRLDRVLEGNPGLHPTTQPRPARSPHPRTRTPPQSCMTTRYRRNDECHPTSETTSDALNVALSCSPSIACSASISRR